ncbi:hypothetical protein [Rariglobus hedericola]|uniref:Uncharacterized protein n=1 Tax=Rariglobus hedericola TaxID=2597822 RepID=A0A556QQJ5_9BACT|nr:hypothetical protein [Rariglobus hedericola]TSJ78910.1 hypothetical protein FPL22_06290 [Rariglobus hedericola]
MIVTSWLTMGKAADLMDFSKHCAGAPDGVQGESRIDSYKAQISSCVLVRRIAPTFAGIDPRSEMSVLTPVAPLVWGIPVPAFIRLRADIPPPPTLTGRVVMHV